MEYVARFEKVGGVLCRFDTRVYLGVYDPSQDSVCVGAIVGKNPGSAMPSTLGELMPLELRGDKMLPSVGNRFAESYTLAKTQPRSNAFVRVWNLFYICGKDLHQAANIASQFTPPPICQSEESAVPLVWFGWGGDNATLNPFKQRFIERSYQVSFFYDNKCGKVTDRVPQQNDFAKHTQGMPAAPMREYLAKVV